MSEHTFWMSEIIANKNLFISEEVYLLLYG